MRFEPPVKESAYPDFPDYEKVIMRMKTPPIIANDFDTSNPVEEARLKSLIYTKYQGDSINPVPTCSCGRLQGGYNQGLICVDCSSVCCNTLERPVETTLWVQTLDGVDKFIGPGFWMVFSKQFTSAKWCLLEYLVLPDYPPPPEKPYGYIVEDLGLSKDQRNLNFFYHNFEAILDQIVKSTLLKKKPRDIDGLTPEDVNHLMTQVRTGDATAYDVMLHTPIGKKYQEEKDFAAFALKYRNQKSRVFTKYLAMPPAAAMVLESNTSGTWYDKIMLQAVDALYLITEVERSEIPKSFKVKNAKTVECIKQMAQFSDDYIRKRWMRKKGIVRSHYVGGRQPFTLRAVIVPITEIHKHDELFLPWAPAVEFFRGDITNKLLRRKKHPEFGRWHPNSISSFLNRFMNQYHPLLDELFQEIIRESNGGIRVLFNRPPSLKRGSIQLMRITRVKTDPRAKSISMSINATGSPNADRDSPNVVNK